MGKGKNKSFIFLLPILYNHIPSQHITKFTNSIINTYIGIVNLPNTYGKFFCLIDNPTNNIISICNNITILNDSQYMVNKALFSFNIERSIYDQYKLFIQGRYSLFSPYFKSLILKYWLHEDIEDLFGILFKTEKRFNKLKEQDTCWNIYKQSVDTEYFNKPIIENELLNLNILK